jgi:hypothetical protein
MALIGVSRARSLIDTRGANRHGEAQEIDVWPTIGRAVPKRHGVRAAPSWCAGPLTPVGAERERGAWGS